MTVQEALAEAHPGTDLRAWCSRLERPEVAVVTLTVTEAAYARTRDGALDRDRPDVRADIDALRNGTDVVTVPGRLAAGLAARRAAGGAPLAVVPCDNLPGNGEAVARVVTEIAGKADPGLADWIAGSVSSSSRCASSALTVITVRSWPDVVQVAGDAGTLLLEGELGDLVLRLDQSLVALPRQPERRRGDGGQRHAEAVALVVPSVDQVGRGLGCHEQQSGRDDRHPARQDHHHRCRDEGCAGERRLLGARDHPGRAHREREQLHPAPPGGPRKTGRPDATEVDDPGDVRDHERGERAQTERLPPAVGIVEQNAERVAELARPDPREIEPNRQPPSGVRLGAVVAASGGGAVRVTTLAAQ